ncbi:hypothetical protein, partial [Paralimibaculum aggregatum]|uniref:hypothetical protein n=1 Tax=Paralimibaculum aggregatum TaxID=3036245 RepID=UPI00255394DA
MPGSASAQAPEDITILRALDGRRLAKRWSRGHARLASHDNAKWFSVETATLSGARDLAGLLGRLSGDPFACVIRGVPRSGIDPNRTRRTCRGSDACFDAAPLRWVALDIDGAQLPETADPLDPDDVLEAVLAILPEAFDGVAFAWQLTGSHAIRPGARVRLWFWLDRPVADAELKLWLCGVPHLDHALFNPVQLHYTAAPIIEGGDFLPLRTGFRDGEPAVAVPPIPAARRSAGGDGDTHQPVGRGLAGHLARIGRGPGKDGFHGPIRRAIGAAFRGRPDLDRAALLKLVHARVEQALDERADPGDRDRDVRREIRDLLDWTAEREAERQAPQPARMPVAEARAVLGAQMDTAYAEIAAHSTRPGGEPLRCLIEAGPGLGKTEAAIRRSVARIRALRAQGNGRVAVFAAPTHRLSDELAARIRQIAPDLRVVVFRGREARDSDGAPMCSNLSAIHNLQAVLGDTDLVCRQCPHSADCRYLAQRNADADICIIAHPRLSGSPPAAIRTAGLDHLVIDESPVMTLLHGVEREVTLPVAALVRMPDAAPGQPMNPDLKGARLRLARALEHPGPVTRARLDASGLTAAMARAAIPD